VARMAKLRANYGEMREIAQFSQPSWYAVKVHVGRELHVLLHLANKQVIAFLPCNRESRKWSDRTKVVLAPLIPGYVFVRIAFNSGVRIRIVETAGVTSFVQFGGVCPSIPDDQIEYLRRLSGSGIGAYAVPGVSCGGERVRVRNGILAGLEGTVVAGERDRIITIAIPAIDHSIHIAASHFDLEAL
jgi:transcriptional antiterminator RfaH